MLPQRWQQARSTDPSAADWVVEDDTLLTLFHAPRSRSTRIIWLLEELGTPYELRHVTIRYMDGGGDGPDAANPHPDKKVPALLHDGALITESAAVATYLADLFPAAELAPLVGDRDRGPYLTWMSWIEGELGPAIFKRLAAGAGALLPDPFEQATRRLDHTLARGPFLLGEHVSAADVMLGGTLGWAREIVPSDGPLTDYLARLAGRPAFGRAMTRDAAPSEGAP